MPQLVCALHFLENTKFLSDARAGIQKSARSEGLDIAAFYLNPSIVVTTIACTCFPKFLNGFQNNFMELL